jgi:hypothetical protein
MLNLLEQRRVIELKDLMEESFASPDDVKELERLYALDAEPFIFVFGSNELGLHGGGAARVARDKYGARYERKGGPGQGFGPQGNSFGIPTCSTTTNEHNHKISIDKVQFYVDCFVMYAKRHPELRFQVTQVGCGLAGWTKEQIAPMFIAAPTNCYFDTDWQPFLCAEHQYWGHIG